MEGVWGYDEDQVALVIPDPTMTLVSWVPVILGTLTINWIINVIKESEIDELSVSLNGLRISHLLACHQAELSVASETAINQTMPPTDLSETVKMIKKEGINAFSSKIIYAWPKTMCLSSNMYVMMQALEEGNGSHLPHGLSILNTYTEMTTGSKWVAVIVKNLTTALITMAKGVKIAQVIAANAIPQVGNMPGMLEKLDKMQGIQRTKMSVEQRKEALFQQLDLSGLEGWSAKNWAAAHMPYLLNTMTSFPWNLGSWAVLIWWNMRSKSLMTRPSRKGSRESLHLWWMRSMLTWMKCWKWAQFAQARACGAMLLCWYARRMEVCASALTFVNWMWEPRRTLTHSYGYRKQKRA